MTAGRRQRAGWWLLIGGAIVLSAIFIVAVTTAPDSWFARPHDAPAPPKALADILIPAGVIVTVAFVLIIPFLSFGAGWAAAIALPLPFLLATSTLIDSAVRADPDMNMASIALLYPLAVYTLSVIIMFGISLNRWWRSVEADRGSGQPQLDFRDLL